MKLWPMPGDDDIKKLIESYRNYLAEGARRFGTNSPERIKKQITEGAVAPDDKFAHPELYYNEAIAKGGFMPLMIYNFGAFTKTEDALDQRIKNWQTIRDTYNAMLKNENNFDAAYESWKEARSVYFSYERMPELSSKAVSEDQIRALYCADLMRKHFEYKASARLSEMTAPLAVKRKDPKPHTDCDLASYGFADLLVQAEGRDGKKIFQPEQIQFDRYVDHVRLRIEFPAPPGSKSTQKQSILLETAGDETTAGLMSDESLKSNIGKKRLTVMTMAQALTQQTLAQERIGENLMTLQVLRTQYLMADEVLLPNSRKAFNGMAHNLIVDQVKKLEDENNAIVDQINGGKLPTDEQLADLRMRVQNVRQDHKDMPPTLPQAAIDDVLYSLTINVLRFREKVLVEKLTEMQNLREGQTTGKREPIPDKQIDVMFYEFKQFEKELQDLLPETADIRIQLQNSVKNWNKTLQHLKPSRYDAVAKAFDTLQKTQIMADNLHKDSTNTVPTVEPEAKPVPAKAPQKIPNQR